jgi:hypothetical protein
MIGTWMASMTQAVSPVVNIPSRLMTPGLPGPLFLE